MELDTPSGFGGIMIGTAVLRCIHVYAVTKLSQTSWSEKTRITKKPVISDAQRQRESVWPMGFFIDAAALIGLWYAGVVAGMPLFNWNSVLWLLLLHCTIVELLYYWLHRALHFSFMYKRWHSYHHASIATEPTTSFSFEIVERLMYTALFAVAPVVAGLLGRLSLGGLIGYLMWFDWNNMLGHFNAEVLPSWWPESPLSLIWYSPSYHSIHHTRFKKNYSLFMVWPDIVFGTVDLTRTREVFREATDTTMAAIGPTLAYDEPCSQHDFMLIVHPSTLLSYSHSDTLYPWFKIAGGRYEPKLFQYLFYPLFFVCYIWFSFFSDRGWHIEECFDWIVGKNADGTPRKMRGTTAILSNIGLDYFIPWKAQLINRRINSAILYAQQHNTRVAGLGALNKAEWLNHGGVDLVKMLGDRLEKTAVVHGDTLTAACCIQFVMQLRTRNFWQKSVFMIGATSKIGRAIALALAKRQIRVLMFTTSAERYREIRDEAGDFGQYLVQASQLSEGAESDLWITGKFEPKGMTLLRAIPRGATVVNFAVPDPLTEEQIRSRPDLLHLDGGFLAYDPANVNNKFTILLPPGIIYACMAGTVVHAAIGLKEHEVGAVEMDAVDSIWESALECGFRLPNPPTSFQKPIKIPDYRVVEV